VINGLQHVFEKWIERHKKGIACQGRYFEKQTVTAPPEVPTRSNKVSPRILQTALIHFPRRYLLHVDVIFYLISIAGCWHIMNRKASLISLLLMNSAPTCGKIQRTVLTFVNLTPQFMRLTYVNAPTFLFCSVKEVVDG
jgi:hypothetical protein